MTKVYCNDFHKISVIYFNPDRNLMVCQECSLRYRNEGLTLYPIKEFSIKNSLRLKNIRTESNEILAKMEQKNFEINSQVSIYSKIETAFNNYVTEVYNVKERLLARVKKLFVDSEYELARQFCVFTEEVNQKNIQISKALINNNYQEMVNNIDEYVIRQFEERLAEFKIQISKINQEKIKYDVRINPVLYDENTIAKQVGIELTSQKMSPEPKQELPEKDTLGAEGMYLKIPPIIYYYDRNIFQFIIYKLQTNQRYIITPPKDSQFPLQGHFPSCFIGENIFFSGGHQGSNALSSSYIINLSTGAFNKKTNMINERMLHCIQLANDAFIYAIGGSNSSQPISSCEKFDIGMNRWETISSLNEAISDITSILFQNTIIYIFGGHAMLNDVSTIQKLDTLKRGSPWMYVNVINPSSSWVKVHCCNSCPLNSDEFLIFGGYSKNILKSSFVFNASTNEMKKMNDLALPYSNQIHKSQPIYFNNEIYAIDDSQNIHAFSIKTYSWRVMVSSKQTT